MRRVARHEDDVRAATIMRLLEFTDSAFPVGTFSFSNGLETAAETGSVRDAATLEAYARTMARQATFTDGIAALQAFRSYGAGDFLGILEADRQAIICKMNAEARLMTCRMGKKLAELSKRIFDDEIRDRWLAYIADGNTAGTYPAAQGIVFAACGISEKGLFCSHQYGVLNMILGAALRCVRVSHYDTQRILFRMSDEIDTLYDEIRNADFEDIHAFNPQADIFASLHEKGDKRLFMN